MLTKLLRIAEVAKEKPMEKFTSLAHLINEPMLEFCHYQLSGNKASGVDGVTKAEYEAELQDNIKSLVERLKRHAYHPQPVRRAYIPKPGTNKMRPLGIPAYEDKLVQMALAKILNAIYEEDFLDSSFGFTHYCSKSMKGRFRVKRKTSKKKYRASLLKCKEWLRQNRNMPANELMERLRLKLSGYYRYYGITDNITMMCNFVKEVCCMLFKWLNLRSQRKSFDWSKYMLFLERFPLPKPNIRQNL
jgi:hypothetical protein